MNASLRLHSHHEAPGIDIGQIDDLPQMDFMVPRYFCQARESEAGHSTPGAGDTDMPGHKAPTGSQETPDDPLQVAQNGSGDEENEFSDH